MSTFLSFAFFIFFAGLSAADTDSAAFFYQDLGCTKATNDSPGYTCPDFTIRNNTCQYKKFVVKASEEISNDLLKGSCHHCSCAQDGRIICATEDCFQRFQPGCSQFKYSLDRCCPVESVCADSKIECEIDGKTYKEGMKIYTKDTCEVCVCNKGFKHEAPFCRRRTCYDQARHQLDVSNFAAPAFFKGENCCPDVWVPVKDDNVIVKMNKNAPADSGVSCKYGRKKVPLGYGFETSVQPYGAVVPLICACTTPPYVICHEK